MKELDKENLPKIIQTHQEFVSKFIEEYKIDVGEIEGCTHVFCWRVDIAGMPEGEIEKYMETIEKNVATPLISSGISCFFIPQRNTPTVLTVLDLRTMKYAVL